MKSVPTNIFRSTSSYENWWYPEFSIKQKFKIFNWRSSPPPPHLFHRALFYFQQICGINHSLGQYEIHQDAHKYTNFHKLFKCWPCSSLSFPCKVISQIYYINKFRCHVYMILFQNLCSVHRTGKFRYTFNRSKYILLMNEKYVSKNTHFLKVFIFVFSLHCFCVFFALLLCFLCISFVFSLH